MKVSSNRGFFEVPPRRALNLNSYFRERQTEKSDKNDGAEKKITLQFLVKEIKQGGLCFSTKVKQC